ncbi:MAG: sodium:proton antiporter [Pseudomonadota bacterium]
MEASAIQVAQHTLTAFVVILAVGAACSSLAGKLKIPDIVLFLLAGMGLGGAGLGMLDISADSAVNQAILLFGASYLLFEGGASLRLSVLNRVWISIVVVSTLGVLITGGIVALSAYWILGVPVMVALLLGATIASTDPATLVPIFKQVPIRDRVAQTVMSESAFNDAMGAIATFTILGLALNGGEFSAAAAGGELLYKAGIGTLVGLVLGVALVFLISPQRLSMGQGQVPLLKLSAVLGAFLFAEHLHASGFMAVFVVGVVVGNRDAIGADFHKEDDHHLGHSMHLFALLLRTFIFILLGSQVDFALMDKYLVGGSLVVAIFMLVARPLTVFICCGPDRRAKWTRNELLFMCWTRETGVIPAALVGMLAGMGAPGIDVIASVTFIAILMTILIQATTTPLVARKLGLLLEQEK